MLVEAQFREKYQQCVEETIRYHTCMLVLGEI